MILTKELIEKHASSNWKNKKGETCVAITKKQALAIELNYPLKKGWLKAIQGINITSNQFKSFCDNNKPKQKKERLKSKYFNIEVVFDNILKELYSSNDNKCQNCGCSSPMPVTKKQKNISLNNLELLCIDCITKNPPRIN